MTKELPCSTVGGVKSCFDSRVFVLLEDVLALGCDSAMECTRYNAMQIPAFRDDMEMAAEVRNGLGSDSITCGGVVDACSISGHMVGEMAVGFDDFGSDSFNQNDEHAHRVRNTIVEVVGHFRMHGDDDDEDEDDDDYVGVDDLGRWYEMEIEKLSNGECMVSVSDCDSSVQQVSKQVNGGRLVCSCADVDHVSKVSAHDLVELVPEALNQDIIRDVLGPLVQCKEDTFVDERGDGWHDAQSIAPVLNYEYDQAGQSEPLTPKQVAPKGKDLYDSLVQMTPKKVAMQYLGFDQKNMEVVDAGHSLSSSSCAIKDLALETDDWSSKAQEAGLVFDRSWCNAVIGASAMSGVFTTYEVACALVDLRYSVSPGVMVAVTPGVGMDLRLLVDSLKKISKYASMAPRIANDNVRYPMTEFVHFYGLRRGLEEWKDAAGRSHWIDRSPSHRKH